MHDVQTYYLRLKRMNPTKFSDSALLSFIAFQIVEACKSTILNILGDEVKLK